MAGGTARREAQVDGRREHTSNNLSGDCDRPVIPVGPSESEAECGIDEATCVVHERARDGEHCEMDRGFSHGARAKPRGVQGLTGGHLAERDHDSPDDEPHERVCTGQKRSATVERAGRALISCSAHIRARVRAGRPQRGRSRLRRTYDTVEPTSQHSRVACGSRLRRSLQPGSDRPSQRDLS